MNDVAKGTVFTKYLVAWLDFNDMPRAWGLSTMLQVAQNVADEQKVAYETSGKLSAQKLVRRVVLLQPGDVVT